MENRWQIYQKIEKSSAFVKAELPLQILKYLIALEEKGTTPTSSEIAYDVLGDSGEMYKDRVAFIRVQVHNLRKKLNAYYLSEGKEDVIKITIPKGSYQIKFREERPTEKEALAPHSLPNKPLVTRLLLIAVALLCGVITYLLLVWHKPSNNSLSPLITSLVQKDTPLTIVLGNRLLYKEYEPQLNRYRYILDTDNRLPNDQNLFWQLKTSYPEKKIVSKQRDMSYIDFDNIDFASKIAAHLGSINKEYRLKMSSQLTELKSNVIYISNTYSGDMYLLRKYFDSNRLIFKKPSDSTFLGKRIDYFVLNDTSRVDIKPRKNNAAKRYFIIKKKTTFDGFSILYLISNQNFAQKYIQMKLFNPSFTEEIEEKIGSIDAPFFEVLLEIDKPTRTHKIIYASKE